MDQTQTPEFKRWFAGSKVVDAKGRPLVVYHGGEVFDAFIMGTEELRVRPHPVGNRWGIQASLGHATWTWVGQPFASKEEANIAIGKRVTVRASYATDDIETASSYAGQYPAHLTEIKPLYLRIINPLDLRDK